MKPGTILISMLHYPTRPTRIALFKKLGLKTISLDSIVNDNDIRLVENMKAVAWNGLEVAFDVLEEHWPDLRRPDGKPIQTLVLGTGMVGKHAVDAAVHLGNIERNNLYLTKIFPGTVCRGCRAKPDPELSSDDQLVKGYRYPDRCHTTPSTIRAGDPQRLDSIYAKTRDPCRSFC